MNFLLKHFCIPISILLFMVSCGTERSDETTAESEAPDYHAYVDSDHNARTSLDYRGTYQGITPCADCEGIDTELVIGENETFRLSARYLGKDDVENVYTTEGSYVWDESGNVIILLGLENRPAHYFISENYVVQLDMEGRRITGDLADQYVLRMQ
ncbi:MAG: copper resistance protein NlpE [Balneolales bacterium]|nr:copper resistance protein NlpE [Balneolales bacterium]